jgi:hypothetical protein
MAFEGLIRRPKIELYVGVVKRVSPIWINFEVNREARAPHAAQALITPRAKMLARGPIE